MIDREHDPAFQAVDEAGGGESEGFEQAEAELVEQAENFDDGHSPLRDAFPAEEPTDQVDGEADHELSSEEDPDADQDW
jgi:hypothetical protein